MVKDALPGKLISIVPVLFNHPSPVVIVSVIAGATSVLSCMKVILLSEPTSRFCNK